MMPFASESETLAAGLRYVLNPYRQVNDKAQLATGVS
jgi:hypothetical protein